MIDKTKIQEFIDWYHQNNWILHLPFIVYFCITMHGIGMMKIEVAMIEKEIDELVNDSEVATQKLYQQSSFLIDKNPRLEDFFIDLKRSLDFVQSPAFLNSEDFEGELLSLENEFRELLGADIRIFDVEQLQVDMAKSYPIIKRYISSKFANQMISILYSRYSIGSYCSFSCRYFDPTIQQFGDRYFIYPNTVFEGRIDDGELMVNGELIEDYEYQFHPTSAGMHIFDVKYSYVYNNKLETINYRKGLLVK